MRKNEEAPRVPKWKWIQDSLGEKRNLYLCRVGNIPLLRQKGKDNVYMHSLKCAERHPEKTWQKQKMDCLWGGKRGPQGNGSGKQSVHKYWYLRILSHVK